MKHLSDLETIEYIKENLYTQYFLGLNEFYPAQLFDASLFVQIRKRMGLQEYDQMNRILIKYGLGVDANPEILKTADSEGEEKVVCKGKLKIDATVADQYIQYPTDLDLLNKCREIAEGIIDEVFPDTYLPKKPRTYRRVARRAYLNVAKKKNKSNRAIRKAIRKQLNYIKRDFKTIDNLLNTDFHRSFNEA